MRYKAKEDLAMVLPIPTKPGTRENGVRFISLENYARFFADLGNSMQWPQHISLGEHLTSRTKGLPVVSVGSFDASFVPTLSDFQRLDSRFRLPHGTWEKLPQYSTYGFAVFKLKPGVLLRHPMAFAFPSSQPESLFFPTVHIHDGRIHKTAEFDHTLYCQRASGTFSLVGWDESLSPAGSFTDVDKSQGLVLPEQHCHRRLLMGNRTNEDVWLYSEA